MFKAINEVKYHFKVLWGKEKPQPLVLACARSLWSYEWRVGRAEGEGRALRSLRLCATPPNMSQRAVFLHR